MKKIYTSFIHQESIFISLYTPPFPYSLTFPSICSIYLKVQVKHVNQLLVISVPSPQPFWEVHLQKHIKKTKTSYTINCHHMVTQTERLREMYVNICVFLFFFILPGFISSKKLSTSPFFLHITESSFLCYTNFKMFSTIYSFFIVHIKTWLQDLQ